MVEPLCGGRLCQLSEADEAKPKARWPGEGIPAWSLRFLQSIPDVVVTLPSGMSNMAQLQDNLRTFADDKPVDAGELDALYV